MTDKPKYGVARMLEQNPTFWARGNDWNEAKMKSEIKKKIIAKQK
jgi:hypothetical protein